MNDLYGNGVKLNEKVLDLLWKRQSMTSANIANVDTPGYKSLYMSFEISSRTGSNAAPPRTAPRRSAMWHV